MPNRILRESILTSQPVCSLGWPEEVFYRRLMHIVDDFGRYEAFPQLLRAKCYPLQTDQVRVADITRWIAACVNAGLIAVYDVDGKSYLEIAKFGQQQRTPSKFPAPPSVDSKCSQAPANEHLGVFVFEGVSVVDKPPLPSVVPPLEPKPKGKKAAPECPEAVDPQVWADWLELRAKKRAPVTATVIASATLEAEKAAMTLEAFLRVWCARGSQGLQADWLKPSERAGPASNETAFTRDRKAKAAAWMGSLAPGKTGEVIEMEAFDGTRIALG